MTLKAQYIKEQIMKLNFIKIKIFCSPSDTVMRMNSQATDSEKNVYKAYIR